MRSSPRRGILPSSSGESEHDAAFSTRERAAFPFSVPMRRRPSNATKMRNPAETATPTAQRKRVLRQKWQHASRDKNANSSRNGKFLPAYEIAIVKASSPFSIRRGLQATSPNKNATARKRRRAGHEIWQQWQRSALPPLAPQGAAGSPTWGLAGGEEPKIPAKTATLPTAYSGLQCRDPRTL